MKKIISLIFIIFLTFHGVHAQWIQSENLVGGSIVNDMIEYKGSLYVSMVNNGIFKSEDKGESWFEVKFSELMYTSIFVIHNNQLFIGDSGKLYKTEDGETWTMLSGPDTFPRDIASNGSDIFLVTTSGIFKSGDEGVTWNDVNTEETNIELYSIATSASKVFVGGKNGTLFTSIDFGQTWDKTKLVTDYPIMQIFTYEENVYLNTGTDGILKSADNGENWVRLKNADNPIGSISEMYVEDSSVFFLQHSIRMYKSEDGGDHWIEKKTEDPGHYAVKMFVTKEHIYLGTVGGGVFQNSRDINEKWEHKSAGLSLIATNDLFVKDNTIFAGTQSSFIRSSYDEGEQWNQILSQYKTASTSAWFMHFWGDYLFAGMGGDGVHRSSDYGTTWEVVNDGLENTLVEGIASNEKFVFVGTDVGIFRSENSGDSWTDITHDIQNGIRAVYTHNDYVLAGTWNGLFISEDNGASWDRISTGLPDESIGELLFIDSVLFAATQFNGLYNTSDLGATWNKVNDNSTFSLMSRNRNIFIGSWNGTVLMSQDMGANWTDISNQLPDCIISDIDFSDNFIIAGTRQPGLGIWKRPLHEIMPPLLSFYSSKSDSTFLIGQPIYIASDQELRNTDGSVLDSTAFADLIFVRNSQNQEVSFIANINADNKLVELIIEGAGEGENYTITVDSLKNISGLANTITTSNTFKAILNNTPTLTDLSVINEVNSEISLNITDFTASFADLDGDTLVSIIIKSVPEHGVLKYNDEIVLENDEFLIEEINNLVYLPNEGYSGTDHILWNGFDGSAYAEKDAILNFDITKVTGVSNETVKKVGLRAYPNPIIEELNLIIDSEALGIYQIQLLDISGREIKNYSIQKTSVKFETNIALPEIPKGIYLLKVNSIDFQYNKRIIKR